MENVKSYLKNRSVFVNRCNNNDFREAVRLCDDFCSKQSKALNEMSVNKEDREIICQDCLEKDARIIDLLTENGDLKAKIEDLESKVNKSTRSRRQSTIQRDYEVERLLDDKIVRGKRKFLVHWKNFGSEYDTWENEHNLNCPDILQGYWTSKDTRRE